MNANGKREPRQESQQSVRLGSQEARGGQRGTRHSAHASPSEISLHQHGLKLWHNEVSLPLKRGRQKSLHFQLDPEKAWVSIIL